MTRPHPQMKNWDTVTITLNRYIEEETDRKTESDMGGKNRLWQKNHKVISDRQRIHVHRIEDNMEK